MEPIFHINPDFSILKPYTIHCDQCYGLCCVALYFSRTDGFPENKNSGIPCKNLLPDYRCNIHTQLKAFGLNGCMAYDCFGAGQQVSKLLAISPNWHTIAPREAEAIFDAYLTVLQLHQTLWYLSLTSLLRLKAAEQTQLQQLWEEGQQLVQQPIHILQDLKFDIFRQKANGLLKNISLEIATKLAPQQDKPTTKNYLGKDFKRANLTGKDFTMTLLIAADLEGAQLYGANFLGADLRDANIANTDLSQTLFLTQIQINSAKGNAQTILPPYLQTPATWG